MTCFVYDTDLRHERVQKNSRIIREKYKLNFSIAKYNQVTFETKCLKGFGPKIWKSLHYHIKPSENLDSFKMII